MKRNKKENFQGTHWHPDFRDSSALPDVKVVRTSFFLNVCAAVVLSVILIVFLYREIESRSVAAQIESWEERVAERGPQHESVTTLYRQFSSEAAKIEVLNTFLNQPAVASELLSELARSVPDRIVLSRVNYTGQGNTRQLVLAGRVLGASDNATDVVSDYEAFFAEDPYFSGIVRNVNVRSVNRNPEAGTLSFDFVLSLNADAREEG